MLNELPAILEKSDMAGDKLAGHIADICDQRRIPADPISVAPILNRRMSSQRAFCR
jgi:hypothetical protein